MKKLLIAVVVLSVAMFSCDEDTPFIKVEKNLSRSTELSYSFNTVGSISELAKITSRQLIETITGDIEGIGMRDGYTITGLTIQSINAKLVPKAGNNATGINSASYISSDKTPTNVKLINEQILGMGNGGNVLVNTHLAFEGVDAINGFLREAVGNKGFNSTLLVKVIGLTSPATARAVADLKLSITFNIEYWYCEQSVLAILSSESECD